MPSAWRAFNTCNHNNGGDDAPSKQEFPYYCSFGFHTDLISTVDVAWIWHAEVQIIVKSCAFNYNDQLQVQVVSRHEQPFPRFNACGCSGMKRTLETGIFPLRQFPLETQGKVDGTKKWYVKYTTFQKWQRDLNHSSVSHHIVSALSLGVCLGVYTRVTSQVGQFLT